MSRKKQTEIEEMRLAISEKQSRGFLEIPPESKGCSNGELAEHLIVNKGYVKTTDVAEEIFAEIEKRFMYRTNDAYKGDIFIDSVDFAELKKRYTEGGE